MTEIGLYHDAHLVASAVRILDHQKAHPPAIEDVFEMLSYTGEQGHRIINKLTELGIVEVIDGTFGTRLFLRDHLKIEEIPKESEESSFGDAIKEFQDSRKNISDKIKSIQADQAKKKKDLFAELENQLKKKLDK